jgi:hypothetical protein
MAKRHPRPCWMKKADRLVRLLTKVAALIELVRRAF